MTPENALEHFVAGLDAAFVRGERNGLSNNDMTAALRRYAEEIEAIMATGIPTAMGLAASRAAQGLADRVFAEEILSATVRQ